MTSIIKTPYSFTILGAIIYNAILFSMLGLMLSRNTFPVWQTLGINSHLSNFVISTILVFSIGAISMLWVQSWNYTISLAAVMIAANLITELFIPVMNTRDVIDAYFGIAGVMVSVALLLVMKKVGLRKTVRVL